MMRGLELQWRLQEEALQRAALLVEVGRLGAGRRVAVGAQRPAAGHELRGQDGPVADEHAVRASGVRSPGGSSSPGWSSDEKSSSPENMSAICSARSIRSPAASSACVSDGVSREMRPSTASTVMSLSMVSMDAANACAASDVDAQAAVAVDLVLEAAHPPVDHPIDDERLADAHAAHVEHLLHGRDQRQAVRLVQFERFEQGAERTRANDAGDDAGIGRPARCRPCGVRPATTSERWACASWQPRVLARQRHQSRSRVGESAASFLLKRRRILPADRRRHQRVSLLHALSTPSPRSRSASFRRQRGRLRDRCRFLQFDVLRRLHVRADHQRDDTRLAAGGAHLDDMRPRGQRHRERRRRRGRDPSTMHVRRRVASSRPARLRLPRDPARDASSTSR